MTAYYNEFDPYAAQWLRNLISAGHIAPGDVDERSIVDVQPDDLRGYTQCHFFAGIGGWSYAARLAGWPDDRELWTGSCPCQPFSVAGNRRGQEDDRHLWPVFFSHVRACRPSVLMGEQVAAAVGRDWLDRVLSDLEAIGYDLGATVIPACAVDAPHRRDRLWFVAHPDTPERGSVNSMRRRVAREHAISERAEVAGGLSASGEGDVADADKFGPSPQRQQRGGQLGGTGSYPVDRSLGDATCVSLDGRGLARQGGRGEHPNTNPWRSQSWLEGADGKARRIEPSIRLLAHGVPARVGKLRAYGNAIVPQVAAEVIAAYLDAEAEAA